MLAGSVNGKIVALDMLNVPLTHLAVLRGVGVFDYLITYNHKPFHLEDHVERLFASAREIGLSLGATKQAVCGWVHELLTSYESKDELAVRILGLAGQGGDSLTMSEHADVCILLEQRPVYPSAYFEKGIKVCAYEFQRSFPKAKTTQYLDAVVRLRSARQQGAIEIVYFSNGELLEGATSNIFVVKGKRLYTPSGAVLDGITARVLIEQAGRDFEIEICPVPLEDFIGADEAFLTSSTREIMPITWIDGSPVGDASVGPITREVMARFRRYTDSY